MILFPLFCSFFFTRISAENLSNLIVSEHWAELGVWCPLFIPRAGGAVKCMIHTLWQSRQKDAHRENSHLIITRTTGFVSQGLVFVFFPVWFEVVCTKPRELNSSWTAPCSVKHSPVVCAVGPLWDKQETKWNKNEGEWEGGRLKTERRTKEMNFTATRGKLLLWFVM